MQLSKLENIWLSLSGTDLSSKFYLLSCLQAKIPADNFQLSCNLRHLNVPECYLPWPTPDLILRSVLAVGNEDTVIKVLPRPWFNLTSNLSLTIWGALPPLPTEEMIWEQSSSFLQHFSESCNAVRILSNHWRARCYLSWKIREFVVKFNRVISNHWRAAVNLLEKYMNSSVEFSSQADEKGQCLRCHINFSHKIWSCILLCWADLYLYSADFQLDVS